MDMSMLTFGKKDGATPVCRQCGEGRVAPNARYYCSKRCEGVARTKTRKPCVQCEKRPRNSGSRFCGRACAMLARRLARRPQKPCAHCEHLFWPRLDYANGCWSKFCSRKCRLAFDARRPAFIEAACVACGKKFKRTAAALKRTKRPFCSRDCQHKFTRGEQSHLYRGDHDPNRGCNWLKRAEERRKLDGYRCQRCNKTQEENGQKLSVDHIVPWRAFKDKTEANQIGNLVSLCRPCHAHKTHVAEAQWLRGDRIAMESYRRSISLAPLVLKERD